MKSSQAIVITGMHRSGTSMAAGLLASAGVFIGEKLLPGGHGNPQGHFEDEGFLDFHRRALGSNGQFDAGYWASLSAIPVPPLLDRIADDLIADRRKHPLWGWKDPRTALFLDYWSGKLPNARFVFLYRSPEGVADSLFRRAAEPMLFDNPALPVDCWIGSNNRILNFVKEHPGVCLLASCEAVAEDPARFLNKVAELIGKDLAQVPDSSVQYGGLRRSSELGGRRRLIESVRPEAIALYAELQRLAGLKAEEGSPDSPPWNRAPVDFEDWAQRCRIEGELKRVRLRAETLEGELLRSNAECGELRELNRTNTEKIGQLNQSISGLLAQNAKSHCDRDQAHQNERAAIARVSELEKTIETITGSRSWRLTAWLRRLRAAFRDTRAPTG